MHFKYIYCTVVDKWYVCVKFVLFSGFEKYKGVLYEADLTQVKAVPYDNLLYSILYHSVYSMIYLFILQSWVEKFVGCSV